MMTKKMGAEVWLEKCKVDYILLKIHQKFELEVCF